MELYIDTSDNKKLIVRLLQDGKTVSEKVETDRTKADRVLVVIEELLRESDTQMETLTNISVIRGPGSFTGVRVGVSIANALAFALGISVNNKKIGELEEPVY